ncbi:MAG: DUF4384 domain-containing protein [Archangiaceae bacterium]|nr:DUF4384 domain-containing protein [Archangiaceae bacterium]
MSGARHIPEALLERYLAGDVAPSQRAELEARIAADPQAQQRLAALRADSAAYLIKHPPGPVAHKLAARPKKSWWALLAAPMAVAAAALFFVLQRPAVTREDDFGIKGDLAVAVYRQNDVGQGERVEPGATLKGGDRVRFEVRAGRDGWVAILSRDGTGHVTVYYPYQGATAARYSANEALLPGAIGLDDTRGTEDVWVLFSPKPFALPSYVELLEKGGTPAFSDVAASRVSWTK